jgi:adenylate cyclase
VATEPTDPKIEATYRRELTEGHRPMRIMRGIFRLLPHEPRCKLCNNPFAGIGGKLVAPFGFRPSRKNPNLCRRCCDTLPPGGAEVDIAILFADVRGATELGERMGSSDYVALLNRYYAAATQVLIRHDAIVDKLIGDEVMALFIPGFCGQQYRRRAVDAALDLLAALGYGADKTPWLPVGVGIHAGMAFVGNVGPSAMMDFTALGDAVNTAARLQGAAQAGEIIISERVYEEMPERFPNLSQRELALRGKEEPVQVRVIRV